MRVGVTDFQSLGRVVLDVRGFTVLVGPSNMGKSALIRAIEAALFNRPGEQFVRLGQRNAEVILENVPTADGKVVIDIQWTKGKSSAVYVIGGHDEPFKKVGKGVPPPIIEAGYRDVWVGDKDRRDGEAIRPQVAGQFPGPLFLLDRPGSFIAEVLGTISRHAVLLTAQGRAAGDERSVKQRLAVRQADLAKAVEQRDVLAAVPDLARRVAVLGEQQKYVDGLRAKAALLRDLAQRRRRHLAFLASVTLPPIVSVDADLGQRETRARACVEGRQRLLQVEAADHTKLLSRPAMEVPEQLGYREVAARYHVGRRGTLRALVTLQVPASTAIPPDLEIRGERVRGLVYWRTKIAPFRDTTLPPATPTEFLPRAEEWQRRLAGLQVHVDARRRALAHLFETERGFNGIAGEDMQVSEELALALQDMKVCPVCDRPMEVAV